MSWRVEYAPGTGTVVVTASGQISSDDATAQAAEVIGLLKQHQSRRVLIDYSDALSEVSLPTLYLLPDTYAKVGGTWNARLAVVLPRKRYRIESYEFFELVCKNAGYNVMLFETTDAAEHWLAQAHSAREHAQHPAHA